MANEFVLIIIQKSLMGMASLAILTQLRQGLESRKQCVNLFGNEGLMFHSWQGTCSLEKVLGQGYQRRSSMDSMDFNRAFISVSGDIEQSDGSTTPGTRDMLSVLYSTFTSTCKCPSQLFLGMVFVYISIFNRDK